MGIAPGGEILHNGMDFWWDDEGEGNCWEGNRLLPRRADRQLPRRPAAAAPTAARSSRPARRQGRRLPLLQPVRPQRPGPASPARVRLVRHPRPAHSGSADAGGVPAGSSVAAGEVPLAHSALGLALVLSPLKAAPCVGSSSCCRSSCSSSPGAASRSREALLRRRRPARPASRGTEATSVFQVGDRIVRQVQVRRRRDARLYTFTPHQPRSCCPSTSRGSQTTRNPRDCSRWSLLSRPMASPPPGTSGSMTRSRRPSA